MLTFSPVVSTLMVPPEAVLTVPLKVPPVILAVPPVLRAYSQGDTCKRSAADIGCCAVPQIRHKTLDIDFNGQYPKICNTSVGAFNVPAGNISCTALLL